MASFHLVVPNICQDGHHNCKPQGSRILRYSDFLAREIPLIQRWGQTFGSGNWAVIITYDEGITKSPSHGDRFGNGGGVAFAVLGPPVKDGVYPAVCDHYSLLPGAGGRVRDLHLPEQRGARQPHQQHLGPVAEWLGASSRRQAAERDRGAGVSAPVRSPLEVNNMAWQAHERPGAEGSLLALQGRPISRRTLLKGAGAVGAAGLASPLLSTAAAVAGTGPGNIPIEHIVVDMQQNRSFDHYYGFAPFAGPFGVPPGYSQPNGQGGFVTPYHFTSLSTPDIGHSWTAMHDEWDGGAMDGFDITDGINCMGFYTGQDLPFYYSLFSDFTLCVNYFCSVMGPTWPNRFYWASGTSGGITTNGVFGYGVFDYPIILDLLEAAGVTWKVYSTDWDPVPPGDSDNVFVFWKRWAHDVRTLGSRAEYLEDLKLGRLPQVSFIIPSFFRHQDEHPPANIQVGMGIQQQLVTALMNSSAWAHSVYIITYDESGGFFEHVPPTQLDAYGLGFRVPTWVISPFSKKSHLEPTLYEHSSILKFIEAVFGLPTLASVNHLFDTSTPGGPNNQAANGQPLGPPAPPRDGLSAIGNLMECFQF